MFSRFFAARRARRKAVDRDATHLLTFTGDEGYYTARANARACREKGDRAGRAHWGRVAVVIADRAGIKVGVTGADRYPPPRRRPFTYPNRVNLDALVDLSEAIVALTAGKGHVHTIHNVEAAVRRLVATAARLDEAEKAGAELVRCCRALARSTEGSAAALASGHMPLLADDAGRAWRRLKEAVLGQ